jgi:hypothetical protein
MQPPAYVYGDSRSQPSVRRPDQGASLSAISAGQQEPMMSQRGSEVHARRVLDQRNT